MDNYGAAQYHNHGGAGPNERYTVVLVGGLNGREWLSVASVISFFFKLILLAEPNPDLKYRKNLDWIFIPVANPDGYQYTKSGNSEERGWDRNRCRIQEGCVGVNLNANFRHDWGQFRDPYDRTKDMSGNYPGRQAESEPETHALVDLLSTLERRGNKILAVFNIFGTGNNFLIPYADGERPKNYQDLLKAAWAGQQGIFSNYNDNGRSYRVGSIAQLTRNRTSGTLEDYVNRYTPIPYSYAINVPEGSYGGPDTGYLAAEYDIERTGSILFHGITRAIDAMDEKSKERFIRGFRGGRSRSTNFLPNFINSLLPN